MPQGAGRTPPRLPPLALCAATSAGQMAPARCLERTWAGWRGASNPRHAAAIGARAACAASSSSTGHGAAMPASGRKAIKPGGSSGGFQQPLPSASSPLGWRWHNAGSAVSSSTLSRALEHALQQWNAWSGSQALQTAAGTGAGACHKTAVTPCWQLCVLPAQFEPPAFHLLLCEMPRNEINAMHQPNTIACCLPAAFPCRPACFATPSLALGLAGGRPQGPRLCRFSLRVSMGVSLMPLAAIPGSGALPPSVLAPAA